MRLFSSTARMSLKIIGKQEHVRRRYLIGRKSKRQLIFNDVLGDIPWYFLSSHE